MIEVLIVLLVLSFGLLGHAKLQSLGVRASTEANFRTQAAFMTNEIVERMRANRPAAVSGYYAAIDYSAIDCSTPPAKICSEGTAGAASDCTPNELAYEDTFQWSCSIKNEIPNGNILLGYIAGRYSIQTSWDSIDEDGAVQNKNVSVAFIP